MEEIALQCHPAYRTGSRRVVLHPFTHRAEVFARRFPPLRRGCGFLCGVTFAMTAPMLLCLLLLPNERIPAMTRAEINLLALSLDYRRRLRRIDFHPADRIGECFR